MITMGPGGEEGGESERGSRMRDGGRRGRGQRVSWIHLLVGLSHLGDGQCVGSEQMGESKGDSQVSAFRFEIVAGTHIELEKTG